MPPERQRGCLQQLQIPQFCFVFCLFFFCFPSLFFLSLANKPHPTASHWNRAGRRGVHSFIFYTIFYFSVDFPFTADNGRGFMYGSACSSHVQNFTLCCLPSCLHSPHTPIYTHSQDDVGCYQTTSDEKHILTRC